MQRHMPLGYRIVDGKAEIVPETAQIVTAVFRDYLDGVSTYQIAKNMTTQGVLNASHRPSWNHGSVGKILENTKYTGDDFYPLLIEKAEFERVQRRRQEKAENLGRKAQLNSFTNAALWSGRLFCGNCGEPYRRYVEHSGQTGETVKWKCKHYIWKNRVCCRNVFLTDKQIENAFICIINQVITAPALIDQHPMVKPTAFCSASERLTRQIAQALETREYTADEIKRMVFARAAEQYRAAAVDDWQYQTDKLKAELHHRERQTTFDEALFTATVKKAVIHEDGRMQFYLLNDLLLETTIVENKKKEVHT